MIIAARPPLMIASGRNRNGLLNRMPTSSITAATPTNHISMIQGSLGSFLRVSEYACLIMRRLLPTFLIRPTLGSPPLSALPPAAAFPGFAALPFADMAVAPVALGVRPALPLGGGESVGLLRAMTQG